MSQPTEREPIHPTATAARAVGGPTNSPSPGGTAARTVLFDDLAADLIWPQLLRAGALALRPSRVGLGAVCVLATLLILGLANRLDGQADKNVVVNWLSIQGLNIASATSGGGVPRQAAGEVYQVFFGAPLQLLRDAPILGPASLLLILAIGTIIGGSIARSAACDYAFNHALSWPRALAFGVSRWAALISAVLVPFVLIWGIALALGLGGLLLRVPGLNVVAGALWILAILAGLLATVITLAYSVGAPLLVPAVACEGCDAADAIQRAYAFVLGRPLRLAAYSAILVVQGAVLAIILGLVAGLTITLAERCAAAFAGDSARIFNASMQELTATQRLTRGGIALWSAVPWLIFAGAMVSYFWTAGTLLYLAIRRAADGMDMREVWSDALVPGTYAMKPELVSAVTPIPTNPDPADET